LRLIDSQCDRATTKYVLLIDRATARWRADTFTMKLEKVQLDRMEEGKIIIVILLLLIDI
jgi:hypothetical protein